MLSSKSSYYMHPKSKTIDRTGSDLSKRETQSSTYCSELKHSPNNAQNCLPCELSRCLAEKGHSVSHNQTGVQNTGVRMCVTHQCEFMVSRNKVSVSQPALKAHHTPALQCNGTSWTNTNSENSRNH